MQTLRDALGEDSNQFGPGTDLALALVALLFVVVVLAEHSTREAQAHGGSFLMASRSFSAADFSDYPVDSLVDSYRARTAVLQIVREYRSGRNEYPHIFVVGHANVVDARNAWDRSEGARRERNWVYSSRRAARIARLLQERLDRSDLENLVVVSTGEFDLRNPVDPASTENACVEIVFGKEWKLPAKDRLE